MRRRLVVTVTVSDGVARASRSVTGYVIYRWWHPMFWTTLLLRR